MTGAHTNHIECCWRYAKQYITPQKPQGAEKLQCLLNVYMWRKWYGETYPGGVFCRLLSEIRAMFIKR